MAAGTHVLPPRYREPERIGHGGMGEIFRARDETLGREVAVKVLAERFADDPDVRERFTREALAAAQLSGERHVVTIFDVGEHAGRPFIVMEHLGGGSLEDVRRREGAQPPGRALAWLEQAAQALDAAHARGIVHRDVKPANLLLDAAGELHVADFGIATAAGMDSFTRPGTVLGTAGYLAPEQAAGEPTSPATDLYALAVVAFELLTGRRPFERDNPTAEAAAHIRAPVPAISEANPELPRELDAVFERALAKDPGRRHGSCGELVSELRGAFDRAVGATRVAAAPPPAPPTRATRVAAPPAPGPGRPRPTGAGAGAVALAVLALALLGGAVAYALTRGGDEPAATGGAPRTVVRTLVTTQPGTTQQVTVTTQAPPAAEEPPPTAGGGGGADGVALTDESTELIRQGRYEEALPVAQRAVAALQGSGELYEAYANYNVGKSLLELGRCAEAIPYLDRSEQIQGEREEITRDRAAARDCS
jgi:tetratricopeptide (TPR) repeat protein